MTSNATPRFSVIVPTFDRPEALGRCLDALAAQEMERDRFEVIVVNDGGANSPKGVVERHRGALEVRLLEQANAGPAAARNSAASVARGQYLAFTDDDCLPDPRWLTTLSESVERHQGHAVGGRVENALTDGIYSHASHQLIDFLYGYFNTPGSPGRFFITSNVVFPATRFREIGGFDVTFPLAAAEDRDLCDRWREHGGVIVYDDRAVVRHAHALGLRSYCRQHFNYGRGAFHLHQARARRGVTPIHFEPESFYSRLVGHPMRTDSGLRAVTLSALLLMSQVMYVMGYLLERAVGRLRSIGAPVPVTGEG